MILLKLLVVCISKKRFVFRNFHSSLISSICLTVRYYSYLDTNNSASVSTDTFYINCVPVSLFGRNLFSFYALSYIAQRLGKYFLWHEVFSCERKKWIMCYCFKKCDKSHDFPPKFPFEISILPRKIIPAFLPK